MAVNLNDVTMQEFLVNTFTEAREVYKDISFSSNIKDKCEWFNFILKKLEVFGKNKVTFNRGPNVITQYVTGKTYVSLNKFTILEINQLYPKALSQRYNNESDWSHPFILQFLKHLQNKENQIALNVIKYEPNDKKRGQYLSIYTDIKLFLNMVYGMLLNNASELKVNDDQFVNSFLKETESIQKEIIELSGQSNKLIVYNIDTFIFGCNITDINLSNFDNKYEVELSNLDTCDNVNSIYRHLNYICRKTKTDIRR